MGRFAEPETLAAVRTSGADTDTGATPSDATRRDAARRDVARRDVDVVVLGAGAAGLAAARTIRSASRGRLSVVLVEQDRPGGDCTWRGCVPSKTVLETAHSVAAVRRMQPRGVSAQVRVDVPAVLAAAREMSENISEDESPALLASQGIELLTGTAHFTAVDSVEVDIDVDPEGDADVEDGGRVRLRGRSFVLAVGGAPDVPPPLQPIADDARVLTSDTVWDLTQTPRHLVVVGGGPIGCELAQAFARMDVPVTLVEAADRLLGNEDAHAASVLGAALERDGVTILAGTSIQEVERDGDDLSLRLTDGRTVGASHVLVAAGRRARTDGLGLEVAGVRLEGSGKVAVDSRLRTSAEHVWAAGDCCTALEFTHVADDQGRVVGRNIAWSLRPRTLSLPGLTAIPGGWNGDVVPRVTYTDPEVAHAGMTEAQAHAQWGAKACVAVLPMSAVDRARTAGTADGFVKLVAAPGPVGVDLARRLVGVTVVGTAAGEVLAAAQPALGKPVLMLARTTLAYPTYALGLRMAAAMFLAKSGPTAPRPARSTPSP